MGFPLDSYGVSLAFFMICLWYFFGISMTCLLDSYDISVRLLWDLKRISNGISMIFLEDLIGNSMPFP